MLTTLVDLKGISLAYNTKGSDVGSCLGKGKAAIYTSPSKERESRTFRRFQFKGSAS